VDGVVFTGSKAVGLRIHAGLSGRWIKPALLELGGKNAAIVLESADLDAAAEGVMRSAFSLQNQKCSATSRVYVQREVAAPFIQRLVEKTRGIRMGDPSERDVFFGPVINQQAVDRFARAVIRRERGQHRAGRGAAPGWRVRSGVLRCSHDCADCRWRARSTGTSYSCRFSRFGEVSGLDQALEETNRVEYGLTAGIFSRNPAEVARFFDEVEAGVCYANKRTGATTGPGPAPSRFAAGRHRAPLGRWMRALLCRAFMREQSRTVIEG
jgi:1-pyrroline-5-carboxylate dehydrogenase